MYEILIEYYTGLNIGQIVKISNVSQERIWDVINSLTYDQNYNAEIIIMRDDKSFYLDEFVLYNIYFNNFN